MVSRHAAPVLVLLGALIPACDVEGVDPGDLESDDPYDGVSASSLVGRAVPLNILWRVGVGADRMTTTSPVERDMFPLEGAVFYVPRDSASGTLPLYRLYSGADHMDSLIVGDGGFATEGILGHPWASPSAASGLTPLLRPFNPGTGDHATTHPYETLSGYSLPYPAFGVYGYNRCNNLVESMLPLTDGGVTIESNGCTGGALWRWTHNGTQYLNNGDFGRQMQIAFVEDAYDTSGMTRNPTEAGDVHSHVGIRPGARHGSPLLAIHNSGSTQITRAIPLEFIPEFHGGGVDNPVVYPDVVLGKDITLNFNGMGSVARFTTQVTVPNTLPRAQMAIPSIHLRAAFNTFWTHDARTRTTTNVTSNVPRCLNQNYTFAVDHGGVIIATPDGNQAMGVYGVSLSEGGSVYYFTLWNFSDCYGDGTGEFSSNLSKMDAAYGDGIPAGSSSYNTWIITGTLAQVTAQMNALHDAHVR